MAVAVVAALGEVHVLVDVERGRAEALDHLLVVADAARGHDHAVARADELVAVPVLDRHADDAPILLDELLGRRVEQEARAALNGVVIHHAQQVLRAPRGELLVRALGDIEEMRRLEHAEAVVEIAPVNAGRRIGVDAHRIAGRFRHLDVVAHDLAAMLDERADEMVVRLLLAPSVDEPRRILMVDFDAHALLQDGIDRADVHAVRDRLVEFLDVEARRIHDLRHRRRVLGRAVPHQDLLAKPDAPRDRHPDLPRARPNNDFPAHEASNFIDSR